MKSIIIAGVARAGKTTICEALCKQGNYNHWTCDTLIYAFEKTFPELNINQDEKTQRIKEVSNQFAPFLGNMIKGLVGEELQNTAIFDIYQLMPEDYVQYINSDDVDIYFIGYPDITVEEEFQILRANQAKNEYTQKYDNTYLKQLIAQRIDESKYIQKQCEKYQLPFINTSYQREETIEKLVKEMLAN